MRQAGKIQPVRQNDQIQALAVEGQEGRIADHARLTAGRRQTFPRDAVHGEEIVLAQADLQRAKTEHVGHRAVEESLFLRQQVLSQFGAGQPVSELFHHCRIIHGRHCTHYPTQGVL
ncbi:hypothetical protein D3C78_1435740 [compost metagenome]